MTPEQRTTAPPGLRRSTILSAGAIGFPLPEGPALHVPTFSRSDLVPGTADCLGCGKVITLKQFIAGEVCPGKGARP